MWTYDSYKNWLFNRLNEVKNDLDFGSYSIEVYNEQEYAKNRSIKPKTITIITKFLNSSLMMNVKTQPIQMLIITEENSLAVANSIITNFTEKYNFYVNTDGDVYTKNIYSTPQVISNFNLVGIGYRSVLYVNTTLIILEKVMDITNLSVSIDGGTAISVDPLSATIGYTMGGDTQDFDGSYAQTEKQFSTFNLTLNVSCVKTDFTEKCIKIMNKTSTNKGNETFSFNFNVGEFAFTNFNMKFIGCTLSTAKNNAPSLQLSFSV